MGRYLRVWWAFARSCLACEIGFRASFLMGMARGAVYLVLALVNIEVLFLTPTPSPVGASRRCGF